MSSSKDCACSAAPKLIFPCSGAADVGQVADLAARQLGKAGHGRMYCLAGVGGRVSGILATTQAAEKILVIDGCPLECARHTLEQAGFQGFAHVRLAELGLAKGQSPVSDERVAQVAAAGQAALASQPGAGGGQCCG